jgi:CheY-like chemotaxis protein
MGWNLSGSAGGRRAGSEQKEPEKAVIATAPLGTDPELMRVSDGDGPEMMTNAATADMLRQVGTAAQTVVIVNGNPEMLEVLDTVLGASHYDVVFVESSAHAYSQIKRVQPNLVILCVRIDDASGFQVLSMLKLDEETRGIPVLTYSSDGDADEEDEEYADASDAELFPPAKAAVWMN